MSAPQHTAEERGAGARGADAGPSAAPERPTSAAQLAFAWALVGVPLGWGVYQVFLKSLDLFR